LPEDEPCHYHEGIMALIDVSGRQVYYERHGDWDASDRVPLVLVTGMAGSCSGWLALQVPEFGASRPILIYDHRGIGQSEDPGKPFTIAELADDLIGLLDALRIPAADVLGTFMGGMIAQELALRSPERVRRLVLVGTYAQADTKRQMLLKHWSKTAQHDPSVETLVYNRLLWTLQDETLEQTDIIASMTEYYEREGVPYSADLFQRQAEACAKHDAADRLGTITQPTLIVCGRHDIVTPPKFHRELADLIPGARLVTMSYGGHLVMVESAERFNQIVLQFLDDER
jgi:pimeloyl-ACP methyl ester carboxylesterase